MMPKHFASTAIAAILVTLSGVPAAQAAIAPSFYLEQAAWDATHIVVLEPDRKREGVFRVAESWKGDLRPGDEAPPVDLALNADARRIYDGPLGQARDRQPMGVRDERRILFLIKNVDSKNNVIWQGAAGYSSHQPSYNYMPISTIWIEDGQAFAMQQWKNPGPARMHPLPLDKEAEPYLEDPAEARIKKLVSNIIGLRGELDQAMTIEDPAARAAAIRPVLQRDRLMPWRDGYSALVKCGAAGVPQLCELLEDTSLLNRHATIVRDIKRLAPRDATRTLVKIITEESVFWQAIGADLPAGWRLANNLPPELAATVPLHQQRLMSTLELLADHPTRAAQKPVRELKTVWTSLPQLESKRPGPISKLCDRVLDATQSIR